MPLIGSQELSYKIVIECSGFQKLDATRYFEILVTTYQITENHFPEGCFLFYVIIFLKSYGMLFLWKYMTDNL